MCTGLTLSAPCSNDAVSLTLDSCSSGTDYDISNTCIAAVSPTPTPVDPNRPNPADPNSLASCGEAITLDQCIGNDVTNGKLTLPQSGLLRKCCVWCGPSPFQGSCFEPPFSASNCNCPQNISGLLFPFAAQYFQGGSYQGGPCFNTNTKVT